jgi:hypothetical protein
MKLTTLLPVAAMIATLAIPRTAHAHFIWATIEGDQVRFALLENPSEKPNAQFAKYVDALKTPLMLGATVAGARFCALPKSTTLVFAEKTVGVKNRDGVDYLLSYHAKAATALENTEKPTKAPIELLASRTGDQLIVTALQDGWPVPATEVTLHLPGSEEAQTATTGINGIVNFPFPKLSKSGLVGIRAKIVEEKRGEVEGKKYTQIHHWATLTFPSTATVISSNSTKSEPLFSRILRTAFGENHEIVGKAAFNATLFGGMLTRPQLEIHLQQRALIHNEVHRILNGADPKTAYSTAQKNVLMLLFGDLIVMDSGWPTEAQARPRTHAFLQEIRESEKQGPYFSLGVQHVYYGGITNGGRMIGQKISETLGIKLSYYLVSDGYQEYLRAVDKIISPEARAEMLRGGQAAYRYIIASSDEDVFKSAK